MSDTKSVSQAGTFEKKIDKFVDFEIKISKKKNCCEK